MKRAHDTSPTAQETKKQYKESRCPVSVLSLCTAAIEALLPANKTTPWSRAIHISSSPIADPSLLEQIYATLIRRFDFRVHQNRSPVIPNLATEFPLTHHQRAIAAIHCMWIARSKFHCFEHAATAQLSSPLMCAELRKWLTPTEFDRVLIHASVTNMWGGVDAQELLLQTPSIFARHLETMEIPRHFSYEVMHTATTATFYVSDYPELAESVVYPNIRAIFAAYAARTSQRLRFDLAWIFQIVKLLPLIQAVWPLINLNGCPTPVPYTPPKHTPPETLNWVIENMPRAAKQQFLAQNRAQMWKQQFDDDPELMDILQE